LGEDAARVCEIDVRRTSGIESLEVGGRDLGGAESGAKNSAPAENKKRQSPDQQQMPLQFEGQCLEERIKAGHLKAKNSSVARQGRIVRHDRYLIGL